MKLPNVRVGIVLVLLVALPAGARAQAVNSGGATVPSNAQKAVDPPAANPYAATEQQQERHLQLFRLGAKLWPIYCSHCHQPPNPEEQAPYQWDQIMMHMRTLENLPPQDEFAILEYLKTARPGIVPPLPPQRRAAGAAPSTQ
jgi:hypothetical protein